MIIRYIVTSKGVNVFKDSRSFKTKKYAEKKKKWMEESYTNEFFVEEVLIESKDAQVKLLREALDDIVAIVPWDKGVKDIRDAALAELDKIKGV